MQNDTEWTDYTNSIMLIVITFPILIIPLMLFICIPLICLTTIIKDPNVNDEEEIEIEM